MSGLGKFSQDLCLVSWHRVCAWLFNTEFVFSKLTQGLCLLSKPKDCSTGFVLGKLAQGLCMVN